MIRYFHEADDALKTARNRANGKPVASSTRLFDRDGGSIAVKYHDTDVVTYLPNNALVLDTGGWLTMSTRSRISEYLPPHVRLLTIAGRWYVQVTRFGLTTQVAFRDGMVIHDDGSVTGYEKDTVVAQQNAANRATDKAVKAYVALITPEAVQKAIENQGGDCWLCMALPDDTGHLVSHMAEGYVVCRLLVNAVESKGYRADVYVGSAPQGGFYLDTVKKAVTAYLRGALYVGAVNVGHGRKPLGASKAVWQRGA